MTCRQLSDVVSESRPLGDSLRGGSGKALLKCFLAPGHGNRAGSRQAGRSAVFAPVGAVLDLHAAVATYQWVATRSMPPTPWHQCSDDPGGSAGQSADGIAIAAAGWGRLQLRTPTKAHENRPTAGSRDTRERFRSPRAVQSVDRPSHRAAFSEPRRMWDKLDCPRGSKLLSQWQNMVKNGPKLHSWTGGKPHRSRWRGKNLVNH